MQPRKFRILSAITAGSLAVAVVAITASSGTSQTAKHAALAAQTGSFPPVNLDDCPILHTSYPQGGCVAQLQTDLRIVQDPKLDVDGLFGPVHSQTWNAVTAFQGAYGLKPDGMVGPDTKNALKAAIPGPSAPTPPTAPPATAPAPIIPSQAPSTGAPVSPPTSAVPAAGKFTCSWGTCSVYFSRNVTRALDGAVRRDDDTISGELGVSGSAVCSPLGPVALYACGSAVAWGAGRGIDILHHAATTDGCLRIRDIRFDPLNQAGDTVVGVYADHTAICRSIDSLPGPGIAT